MKPVQILLIACAALCAGCASQSYCVGKQRYDNAMSVRPIETSDGLSLPESPTALVVPPPPANDVPFGTIVKDRKNSLRDRAECLSDPPPFTPAAPPTTVSASPKV